jgi:hypothetical protein
MKQYEVSNLSLKKEVLTYFFDRINYYEYRYLMIKSIDDLKKNEKNIEYVIPHIKGESYFLIFGSFNRKDLSFLIEKKKLKFNLDQCDINDIKILQCNYKSTPKTYIGSIFDGRMINSHPNNIFLIQDCYYLDGIKMNAWKLEKKIDYIDEYISRNMKESNLKIRKVDLLSPPPGMEDGYSMGHLDTIDSTGLPLIEVRGYSSIKHEGQPTIIENTSWLLTREADWFFSDRESAAEAEGLFRDAAGGAGASIPERGSSLP